MRGPGAKPDPFLCHSKNTGTALPIWLDAEILGCKNFNVHGFLEIPGSFAPMKTRIPGGALGVEPLKRSIQDTYKNTSLRTS